MVTKRDVLLEIKDRKTRLRNTSSLWEEVTDIIDNIIGSLDHLEGVDDGLREELQRGLLVRMVACIEGFFRLSIKKIIDSETDYKDNISSLDLKRSVDVETLLAINKKAITLGDIISHSISINNLSDIAKIMSGLLSIEFIKSIKLLSIEDLDNEQIGKVFPDIYVDLDMIFRERHIYAHEIASSGKMDNEYIELVTYSGFVFLYASAEIIEACLEDDSHLSTGEKIVMELC